MNGAPSAKATKKDSSTVYRDPIYGIPHFHDPAIMRIMQKHDPNYQINQSMKAIALKSQQRMKAVGANKPRYLHKRFDIETLTTSPLMCFPHFEAMTTFLMMWFQTKKQKQEEAVTSNQRATFEALSKFCEALFLLLQDTARASPISPKPLIGIYNWYLQRDSVIYQSRTLNTQDKDSDVISIELTNGKVVEIQKKFLDINQILANSSEWTDNFLDQVQKIEPKPEETEKIPILRSGSRMTKIITDSSLPKLQPKIQNTVVLYDNFDYPSFHKKLVEQRQAERDVDRIAMEEKNKRREEIKQLPGFQ